MNAFKCDRCGKFLAYDSAWIRIPVPDAFHQYVADEVIVHRACATDSQIRAQEAERLA